MKTRFGTIKKISAMGLVSVLLLGELSGAVPAKTVYAAGLEGYAAVSEGYEAAEYDLADAPGEAYINTLDEGYLDIPGEADVRSYLGMLHLRLQFTFIPK